MNYEKIVDQIYLASADAQLWPEVLDSIASNISAVGGIILARRSDFWTGWKYSDCIPTSLDDYLVTKSHLSRSTQLLLSKQRAGFVGEHDLYDSDEDFRADAMMSDWGLAQGLHHAAATAIQVPSQDFIVVQFQRKAGEPAFETAAIEHLDAFRPHLARAGLLAARWRMEKLEAAAIALAQIGLPAAVIDAHGKVLVANDLIQHSNALVSWQPNDRVLLVDRAARPLFDRAVATLRNPSESAVRSIGVRGPDDADAAVIHVIPATGWARDFFGGGFGLIVATPLAREAGPINFELLQGLFDLTAAEARVAGAVADGLGPREIADRAGVSYETVRSQVRSVFAKTGTNRQNALAALLARIPRIDRPS
jgi:DNA-binding CsgD family transcriptional regulator